MIRIPAVRTNGIQGKTGRRKRPFFLNRRSRSKHGNRPSRDIQNRLKYLLRASG